MASLSPRAQWEHGNSDPHGCPWRSRLGQGERPACAGPATGSSVVPVTASPLPLLIFPLQLPVQGHSDPAVTSLSGPRCWTDSLPSFSPPFLSQVGLAARRKHLGWGGCQLCPAPLRKLAAQTQDPEVGCLQPPFSSSVSKAQLNSSPSCAARRACNSLALFMKSICSLLETSPGSLLPTLGVWGGGCTQRRLCEQGVASQRAAA